VLPEVSRHDGCGTLYPAFWRDSHLAERRRNSLDKTPQIGHDSDGDG
jgi:hypothetical protein